MRAWVSVRDGIVKGARIEEAKIVCLRSEILKEIHGWSSDVTCRELSHVVKLKTRPESSRSSIEIRHDSLRGRKEDPDGSI